MAGCLRSMAALLVVPAIAAVGAARTARASDLGEALRFAGSIMGEDAARGYEEFIDDDPDEALSLLLSRDVVPGRAPEAYFEDSGIGLKRSDALESLGDTRLNFAILKPYVEEASQESGLPAALIDAVIRTESGYRPKAVSKKGALGLMQIMPETARDLGLRNAFDPRENILAGARYLRRLFDRWGSLRLAVAAYNAGSGAVEKHGGVPPFLETRRYVDTVLSRYQSSRIKSGA